VYSSRAGGLKGGDGVTDDVEFRGVCGWTFGLVAGQAQQPQWITHLPGMGMLTTLPETPTA
jgi:hypothetical protein